MATPPCSTILPRGGRHSVVLRCLGSAQAWLTSTRRVCPVPLSPGAWAEIFPENAPAGMGPQQGLSPASPTHRAPGCCLSCPCQQAPSRVSRGWAGMETLMSSCLNFPVGLNMQVWYSLCTKKIGNCRASPSHARTPHCLPDWIQTFTLSYMLLCCPWEP